MYVSTRAARSCVVRRVAFAATLLSAALTSTVASAFELRHTTSGAVVHWPTRDLVVEVDPSTTEALPGAAEAVAAALAGWGAAEKAPKLTLSVGAAPSSPAIDGRNVIYYAPDGYPEAGAALAITLVSFDDVTGEIVDADIVLNGRYAFATLPEGTTPRPGMASIANDPVSGAEAAPASPLAAEFDLVHVLSHETGHLLGLLDATDEPADVMYMYTSAEDSSRRAPVADDVAGVDALYASVPAGAGCTVASLGARPSRGGGSLASMMGLAWMVAMRRRTREERRPRSVARS